MRTESLALGVPSPLEPATGEHLRSEDRNRPARAVQSSRVRACPMPHVRSVTAVPLTVLSARGSRTLRPDARRFYSLIRNRTRPARLLGNRGTRAALGRGSGCSRSSVVPLDWAQGVDTGAPRLDQAGPVCPASTSSVEGA